ncbi:MAG: phosphohydrolase [Dysgonamonadaceae bacterium]|jgi:(p)ppGpp synthase/HD superfamily hydrolase|nr:phosphohydrolase [Dysgonamonadaceae bacterium]
MNKTAITLKEQLNRAILIAIEAHTGQLDTNNGRPYIEHPFRVMNAGQTLPEKIVGILHDVVEDTPWTIDDLACEGFSDDILAAIDALTRRNDESYDDYLDRVKPIPLAVRVKLNDLSDNMDIRRWDNIPDFEFVRLRKYLKAYKQLTETE